MFCARELEEGLRSLVHFEVKNRGQFPDDETLRQRGRDILGTQDTAADDPVLLDKFKTLVREELGGVGTAVSGETSPNMILAPVPIPIPVAAPTPVPASTMGPALGQAVLDFSTNPTPGLMAGMDISMSDDDINNMLVQDMDFDTIFGQQSMAMGDDGSSR